MESNWSNLFKNSICNNYLIIIAIVIICVLICVCQIIIRKSKGIKIAWGCLTVVITILGVMGITYSPELLTTQGKETLNPSIYFMILITGTALTFIAFYIQYIFNKVQKTDIERERFENHLFSFFATFRAISDNVIVENIGNNKKAFHFIFYQFQTLYYIVSYYAKNNYEEYYNILKKQLPYCCYSFLLSGVTNNSNKEIKFRFFKHFESETEANKNFEESLKLLFSEIEKIVRNLQCVSKKDLKILQANENLLLFTNYATSVIERNIHISWFLGYRSVLLPHIKYLIMIISYTHNSKQNIKNKNDYYKYIYCQMSEHEIGLLYVISNSQEFTDLIGKDYVLPPQSKIYDEKENTSTLKAVKDVIRDWMAASNSQLYNYESWREIDLDEKTKSLIEYFAMHTPVRKSNRLNVKNITNLIKHLFK